MISVVTQRCSYSLMQMMKLATRIFTIYALIWLLIQSGTCVIETIRKWHLHNSLRHRHVEVGESLLLAFTSSKSFVHIL